MALTAASKQATYTFFVAGLISRLAENLAVGGHARWANTLLAITIPSTIAIELTYLVHSMRGTPEPFLSTLPTIVSAAPGFYYMARQAQNEQDEDPLTE